MCACRCGIKVHLRDGRVRYIEGNRDHPVNQGVLCGKGAAGIMQHYSPARLSAPLKRVGPRGSGEFVEIDWDEALDIAAGWLGEVRGKDPRKLAFFTGRDQSPGAYRLVRAAVRNSQFRGARRLLLRQHGGGRPLHLRRLVLGVRRARLGSHPLLHAVRGRRGPCLEPDQEGARPPQGARRQDRQHQSRAHRLQRHRRRVDRHQARYRRHARRGTDPRVAAHPERRSRIPRALHQCPLAGDRRGQRGRRRTVRPRRRTASRCASTSTAGALADATLPELAPALVGEFKLADGRTARPAFQLLAGRFLRPEYAPERAAAATGIAAATIRRLAAELADAAFKQQITLDIPWTDTDGRRHEKTVGRPVSMHAMRGISAHSNGFQTCRLLHILQIILGSIDCPGGFRYKPPFPRPAPPPNKPAGRHGTVKPIDSARRPLRSASLRGRRICSSTRTERPSGSTRPTRGTRRSPPMA